MTKEISRPQPPGLGLALGGGAARGLFHIGAIRALEEAGIKPDIVAGSSVGSLVGAAYSGPLHLDAVEREIFGVRWKSDILCLRSSVRKSFADMLGLVQSFSGPPHQSALVSSSRSIHRRLPGSMCNAPVEATINRTVDWRRLSEIRPLIITGSDMVSYQRLVFASPQIARQLADTPEYRPVLQARSSWRDVYDPRPVVVPFENVGMAARVSSCIPGVMRSMHLSITDVTGQTLERTLNDGGVLENVPVTPLKALGCRRILAIFLGYVPYFPQVTNSFKVAMNAVNGVAGAQLTRSLEHADYVIYDPQIESRSMHVLDPELVESGYRFVQERIPQIRRVLFEGQESSRALSAA